MGIIWSAPARGAWEDFLRERRNNETQQVWPGTRFPLGATSTGEGTNFSVFSEVAEGIELCLFDEAGNEDRLELLECDGFTWHGYLPGIGPGQKYAYRVHGPWDPSSGHRCNPEKLLLDPYAKAIIGEVQWHEAVFGYHFNEPERRNDLDSAPFVPRCVVIDPSFDWGDDQPARTPWHETVIYEMHVKGFTKLHPDIPPEIRGTYAAVSHPVTVEYLKNLGVTAVELLPIHHFLHDSHLVEKGLRNYWGYNSIGYFAPHAEYCCSPDGWEQVVEFKKMVKALHAAGLEVILDVVYNHTAEGNHLGPVLSFKGFDNSSYYRLMEEDRRYYMDYTGTGNTLNMRDPHVLQLVMDSLRYWVLEMHVDGFRFDLAAALARELHAVDRLSAFLDLIQQDPVINQVKLIAEPWDVGEGGYQVGNFPPLWSEWNGKYRDTMRDFWRGEPQTLPEFAERLTGSSDLYEVTGRRPFASINFITAHDGFTLRDLVSFNEKHNEQNLEGNRDGESHNRSWNHGVEGFTDDPAIQDLRSRQVRNFLATLLLSQGIPMIVAGDEIGRTQRGNNNAYCQDNDISWIDWENADEDLQEFTRRLLETRRIHPVFRRRNWFLGRPIRGSGNSDIEWLTPAGEVMSDDDWSAGFAKSLGIFLNGHGIQFRDPQGQTPVDQSFLLLFNAHHDPVRFTIPKETFAPVWSQCIATFTNDLPDRIAPGTELELPAFSVLVLSEPGGETARGELTPV